MPQRLPTVQVGVPSGGIASSCGDWTFFFRMRLNEISDLGFVLNCLFCLIDDVFKAWLCGPRTTSLAGILVIWADVLSKILKK
jgi:hypothetical protein